MIWIAFAAWVITAAGMLDSLRPRAPRHQSHDDRAAAR
jgi:hypothetical protein